MNYVRQSLAALASAALITACGGGGEAAPASDATASTPTLAAASNLGALPDVQVEGCVLNDTGSVAAITPVHARGEDGRLLASTTSNDRGIYTLRLPARHSITLSTTLTGPAELVLLTGRGNLSIGGCLRSAA